MNIRETFTLVAFTIPLSVLSLAIVNTVSPVRLPKRRLK